MTRTFTMSEALELGRFERRKEARAAIPDYIGKGPNNTSAARSWVYAMRTGIRPEEAGGWRQAAMILKADQREGDY
jgi:hypothetical protein